MTTIRAFEARDAEAVSTIIRKTMAVSNIADYALERLQPLMDYFSPEKVLLLSYERICLVAEVKSKEVESQGAKSQEVDAQVVGTIALEGSELCTFFILPEYQGMGIGSQLLEEIERLAVEAGLEEIHMDASLTGAPFYERRGYHRTGHELDGTAGTQIGMVKRL